VQRASEPVGPQECRPEIDEKARCNGDAQDQVEHCVASHPLKRADAKGKNCETGKAEGKVDDIQHRVAPDCY
jgi:hypothetical protein